MPPLTATVVIGAGSVVTVALSVLTVKALAVLLGPSGVGAISLMQALVSIAAIVASMGVATVAVAKIGAELRASPERWERGAIAIGWIGGVGTGLLLIVLRQPLAVVVFNDSGMSGTVAILAPAVAATSAAAAEVAILTGHRRVSSIVSTNIGTYVAAAVFGLGLAVAFGTAGLAPAVLATAIAQLGLASLLRARMARQRRAALSGPIIYRAAGTLVRGGVPIAASQLVGLGAQLAVPILIVHVLSAEGVGQYRAAAAVSLGYMTFFVGTLVHDYLARAAATSMGDDLAELIGRRMRLMAAIAIPALLGLLAVRHIVVELLYTAEFTPAIPVLEWIIVGDLVRLPGAVLAITLLSRGRGVTYLVVELVFGASLLVGTSVGLTRLGLVGAGVAYFAACALYLAASWFLVRRTIPAVPGRVQLAFTGTAALAIGVLLADVSRGVEAALFAGAAGFLAIVAWPKLLRLHRGGSL